MIPSDPHRPVIDPRRLVREHGRDALAELVARESGYIFQLRPLKDLCQSLQSGDRKSTRLNSSHDQISYAVFCLKKKNLIEKLLSWSSPITITDVWSGENLKSMI